MKIEITVTDDENQAWKGSCILTAQIQTGKKMQILAHTDNKFGLIGAKKSKQKLPITKQHKRETMIDKINSLIDEGFFIKHKTIGDIVEGLKTKDYHHKSYQLTTPLRKMVRAKSLKRTKDLPNNKKSKNWMYISKDVL